MARLLKFENVSKSFFGTQAVKDVTLEVHEGGVLGLIGENGAGKTTLMNILGGVVTPDEGRMYLRGEEYVPADPADASAAGIGFIHQELNLFTNLTVAENLFIEGFPRLGWLPLIRVRMMYRETRKLLHQIGLEVSPGTLVSNLSPGERQLVEIAKALSGEAQIVIFDEPTTSLTSSEAEWLFSLIRQLRSEGKSIIYISHALEEVKELADEVAVLRNGEVVGTGSNEDMSINHMISLMVGRDISEVSAGVTAQPAEEVVFEARDVSEPGIVDSITFHLHRGEILGLFGLMGSGRTELARIIFGLDPYRRGEFYVQGRKVEKPNPKKCIENGIAFITEDRHSEGLMMDLTIAANLDVVGLPGFSRPPLGLLDDERLTRAVDDAVKSLRIKTGDPYTNKAKSLSGGNQQKAVVGKWLVVEPTVLIMDEPTRGIDVGAKYELYNLIDQLARNGSGILFISSEIEELLSMCHRIMVMNKGQFVGTFPRSHFDKENILRAAFRQMRAAETTGMVEYA